MENDYLINFISKINNIDIFTSIAFQLAKEIVTYNGNLQLERMIELFERNYIYKEEEIILINNIDGIQEKIFLFVLSCLNGFSKTKIYNIYLNLQNELVKFLSEDEIDQIKQNKFWSLPWNERLGFVSSEIKIIENNNNKETIEIVCVEDNYDMQKIISYFLNEYDWYEIVKKWIIDSACKYNNISNWSEKQELLVLIKGLMGISHFNYIDMKKTMHNLCIKKKITNNNIEIVLYAGYLREIYNSDKKKDALQLLHKYLISDNIKYNLIGLKVYSSAFSDIKLNKIEQDILQIHTRYRVLEKEIAYCLFITIFYQEDKHTNNNSIFNYIINEEKLWEEDNIEILNWILYFLAYWTKYYYSNKDNKKYLYPVVIYLFGMNKEIRNIMVNFFYKALMNTYIHDNTKAFFEYLFKVIQSNDEIPNLMAIYKDFSQRIKNKNEYCNKIISGIENEYIMLYDKDKEII